LNDPATGTVVKLPGTVAADPTTGRLTATFKENPQLPVAEIKLDFQQGNRATLTTPQTCGAYETISALMPWSAPESGPPATPGDRWGISAGPGGSACANSPAQQPNKPTFSAGSARPDAGAYSPFVLELSREDGSQRLTGLNATLPKGLTGRLAGIPYCSEPQLAAAGGNSGKAEKASPSCPLASQVGTVDIGAGSGPTPFHIEGHAYLAGPYKGAPLSMAIVTPALGGPFDLGTIVVRAALYVDPETAQITVKSDPIPTMRSGIGLDVRRIAVDISRNQFTLNPTSCDPMSLTGTAFGARSDAALASPFQVGGCQALGFKPRLSLRLLGPTHRGAHPRFRTVLRAARGGVGVGRVAVILPGTELLDNVHLQTICTTARFAAGRCPAGSVYGHAKAWTPLLDKPLEGPVYLRSSRGKLPDLVASLDGQIHLDLTAHVDSAHGRLRIIFPALPDAPLSKLALTMRGAKKGLLVNTGGVCASKLRASVGLIAQNGKRRDAEPEVKTDCGKRR
jgi:hypothetical protein